MYIYTGPDSLDVPFRCAAGVLGRNAPPPLGFNDHSFSVHQAEAVQMADYSRGEQRAFIHYDITL